MQMSIHEAKLNLSRMITAAERGEEVVIARRDHRVVKLVKLEGKPPTRKLGGLTRTMDPRVVDFLTDSAVDDTPGRAPRKVSASEVKNIPRTVPCLLDTDTMLWALYEPKRLSPAALESLTHSSCLAVSIVSFWKIGLKISQGGYGKLIVPKNWHLSLSNELQRQGYQVLGMDPRDCHIIGKMPFHHDDLFDRMLVAQALNHKMDFICRNEVMDPYGVHRVW